MVVTCVALHVGNGPLSIVHHTSCIGRISPSPGGHSMHPRACVMSTSGHRRAMCVRVRVDMDDRSEVGSTNMGPLVPNPNTSH